jgi:2,4-dienoyl-CoA reductase-like NADH-dependent reductase (Old Yellow Enzyme family)
VNGNDMSRLFEPNRINGMELSNRFVRSATWEGMADENGGCTPQLLQLNNDLAEGGVGLIISSYAYVLAEGKARIGQLGIHEDNLVEGYRQMAETAHQCGSRIVAQIVHAGIFSDEAFTGQTAQAPSHVPDLVDVPHEEMSTDYIQRINEAFGQAARRVKEAGYDGVQVEPHPFTHIL